MLFLEFAFYERAQSVVHAKGEGMYGRLARSTEIGHDLAKRGTRLE